MSIESLRERCEKVRVGVRRRKPVRSVEIGGKRWRILWQPPNPEDSAVAMCHYDKRVIQIDPALSATEMVAAVLDEIAHAVFGHTIDNDYIDQFSDDATVALYSLGLICDRRDKLCKGKK